MPDKFNELLLKQDIIELYNAGITPDYGYLMNGRFEKDMIKTLYPLKTLSGNPISWEASNTEYLFPVVSLEPKQAGSGDPSPENVRPISGYDSVTVTQSKDEAQVKQIALTFPETIYGGRVDAVTGEGEKTWGIRTFTGDSSENWRTWGVNLGAQGLTGFFLTDPVPMKPNPKDWLICSMFVYNLYAFQGQGIGIRVSSLGTVTQYWSVGVPNTLLSDISTDDAAVSSWKSYLAAQAAAGTPLQVVYKLATPEPFQATGNQALTSFAGYNTIYTNGDSMTLNRKIWRLEV